MVREEIKKFDKEVRDTVKAPHANIADWYCAIPALICLNQFYPKKIDLFHIGTHILARERMSGAFLVKMISNSGFLQLTVNGGRDTGDCCPN